MGSPTVERTADDVGTTTLLIGNVDSQDFRREIGHISRHSSIYFAGTVFALAAGYPFKIYLARVLGAEALGLYALGMTIVGFFAIFNDFGLAQAAVRFVSAYVASGKIELLRNFLIRGMALLLLSNLCFGMIVWLAGPWIAVHLYHAPALIPCFGGFACIMLFGAMNAFLGQALSGYKDVARRVLITTFIGGPLTIILTIGFITAGLGLPGYIFAQAVGAFSVGIFLLIAVWRLTPRSARSVWQKVPVLEKEVISFSTTALGLCVVEYLIAQADKVFIGFYLHAREVGVYAIVATLIAFVPIILDSVNQIFSPGIAHLHARGEIALLGRMYQTLTKWILGLTIPLAGVMIIFASPLMRIFGHDFEVGWPVLIIGTVGQFVNCGVGSVGYLLLMSGNQGRLMKIQSIMAAVTILLSICLIPRWGLIGAALASATSNVGANLLCLLEVRRRLGVTPYNRTYLRLTLPMVMTVATLSLVHRTLAAVHPDWIVIAAGLVLGYFVFLATAATFGLDADDKVIVSAVWSRLRQVFHFSGANA
jgi:O-antigen/teichoic acid export membrane protein